jgi:hypothetical protein
MVARYQHSFAEPIWLSVKMEVVILFAIQDTTLSLYVSLLGRGNKHAISLFIRERDDRAGLVAQLRICDGVNSLSYC